MLFEFAKKSNWLQNLVVNVATSVHPSIEHNLEKIKMLKRAFFHCELEHIEGGYFEFGVYEGTSLYAAATIQKKLKSEIARKFYGFDSFDDGFKYFDPRDQHPFFREGDFKSSYVRVEKRLRKFGNVSLIKGYFEHSVAGKSVQEVCGCAEKCAVCFIDCDLMNPAMIALEFVRPALQPGSVIILDDYWAYKASDEHGTRGALKKFLEKYPSLKMTQYYTYGHGGNSFVVVEV